MSVPLAGLPLVEFRHRVCHTLRSLRSLRATSSRVHDPKSSVPRLLRFPRSQVQIRCGEADGRGAASDFTFNQKVSINTSFQIGKYLISPLIKHLSGGTRPGYSASVSIRSGAGPATHDRVLRLAPVFDDPQTAARYATHQGMVWIGMPHSLQDA